MVVIPHIDYEHVVQVVIAGGSAKAEQEAFANRDVAYAPPPSSRDASSRNESKVAISHHRDNVLAESWPRPAAAL